MLYSNSIEYCQKCYSNITKNSLPHCCNTPGTEYQNDYFNAPLFHPQLYYSTIMDLNREGAMTQSLVFSLRLSAFAVYQNFIRCIRIAFRIASNATPTSAKTASHIVATPPAPSMRTIILMPMARPMFCHTIR